MVYDKGAIMGVMAYDKGAIMGVMVYDLDKGALQSPHIPDVPCPRADVATLPVVSADLAALASALR
jgi:hypothetical protein